jgi:hypothetical protein
MEMGIWPSSCDDETEYLFCDWCGEVSDTDICTTCQYRYACEAQETS